MKTTFKKTLSIVVAFCLLIASATCLMGISAFADGPVNLALNKNTIASSAAPGYGSEKAVDGDTEGVQWQTTGVMSATAWMAVDLGGSKTFDTVKTYLGKGSTGQIKYAYDIYVASAGDFTGAFTDANKATVFDGVKANGTKVATVDASNSVIGGVTSTFTEIEGQYVLVHFTGCAYDYDAADTISL